jgi:hypothetical protein
MIYVRRDPALIPEKVLRVAERAQQQLEQLPESQRPSFIKKKSHIWRAFARYLAKMSYGKCWYSESPDPQSFFDVDHYRPKLEAKRSGDLTDPGYEWLAFSWDNFRLSAHRSNRVSRNEETDENEGKGNWFPLLDGSAKACWDDRCEQTERPVLLDPVKKSDVQLLDVLDDGRMGPSFTCIGSAQVRVEQSIKLYGLNLPALKAARVKVMREVIDLHAILIKTLEGGRTAGNAADVLPVNEQIDIFKRKTMPSSSYSKAARAQLAKLGGAVLCLQPEEMDD